MASKKFTEGEPVVLASDPTIRGKIKFVDPDGGYTVEWENRRNGSQIWGETYELHSALHGEVQATTNALCA